MSTLGIVITLAMFLCIFLIPIGWPGLWLMVALVGLGAVLGTVGWGAVIIVIAVAAVAEAVELLIVKRMSVRYGGSSRAFWGAVAGGMVGLFMGFPVPIIGPVIAGLLGSFAGAAAVAYYESGDVASASRVGWGVVLARALASCIKVGAALVVLVVGGTAWIVS